MVATKKRGKDAADPMEEMRKRYELCVDADRDNRDAAREDWRFVNEPGAGCACRGLARENLWRASRSGWRAGKSITTGRRSSGGSGFRRSEAYSVTRTSRRMSSRTPATASQRSRGPE
jgi:hypothetical protein